MDARDRTPEPREARETTPQAPTGAQSVQRAAAGAMRGRGMTIDGARALQAAAGNRTVARMAKTVPNRTLARSYADDYGKLHHDGNLEGGWFKARIGSLGEHIVTVLPWKDLEGGNANDLRIRGFQKTAERQPSTAVYTNIEPPGASEPGF